MKAMSGSVKVKIKKTTDIGSRIERLLFAAFAAAFAALLIIQSARYIPLMRSEFFTRDIAEGTPMGTEEYLYTEGMLEFRLMEAESCPSLKVLVNGEERGSFTGKTFQADVIDGDVLEIDGTDVPWPVNLSISSMSSSMDAGYLGKTYQVNTNVLKIMKIRIPTK